MGSNCCTSISHGNESENQLPYHIFEETTLPLNQINWEKIWEDDSYMRYTMSLTQPITRQMLNNVNNLNDINQSISKSQESNRISDHIKNISSSINDSKTNSFYNNNDQSYNPIPGETVS